MSNFKIFDFLSSRRHHVSWCHQSMTISPSVTIYYLYITYQTILTRKITILNVVLTVLMSCSKKSSYCSNFWKFPKMTVKLGQLIWNFAKWCIIPLDIIFNHFCTILSNFKNFDFCHHVSSCHQSMTISPSVTLYYLYLTYQTILTRKSTILDVVLTVLMSCSKKFSSCSNFVPILRIHWLLVPVDGSFYVSPKLEQTKNL